ncbi:hypothetical protein Tco_1095777 [Tanacetum coccineum]
MQQFWFTISKIKDSSSYQFKHDKKKCRIDVEVFRDILQICPRLHNQEFDEPPSDEEIISFVKELGYKGEILIVTSTNPMGDVLQKERRHCGSGDGAGLEPEVPDEQKGKSIDTHEGIGLKPRVFNVSKVDSSDSEYESWGVSDDDDDDDKQGDDKRTQSDDDKNMYL